MPVQQHLGRLQVLFGRQRSARCSRHNARRSDALILQRVFLHCWKTLHCICCFPLRLENLEATWCRRGFTEKSIYRNYRNLFVLSDHENLWKWLISIKLNSTRKNRPNRLITAQANRRNRPSSSSMRIFTNKKILENRTSAKMNFWTERFLLYLSVNKINFLNT